MKKKRLLVFHPIIAPYRIDFFNALAEVYDAEVCMWIRNLNDNKFDYEKIEEQFHFRPTMILKSEMSRAAWLCTLWRKLCKAHADIVLVSEFNWPVIVTILHKLLTRAKYRIISMVDDSYNMAAEGNQFSFRHKWATKVMTPFLNNVVNVEPRVTDYYQQRYGKGVYFPIICDDVKARKRLQRILPMSEEIVKRYNLEGKKVLLFVGRLIALKNVVLAIHAYQRIANSNTVFIIVGDGTERESFEREAAGRTDILFTGRLEGERLYAYYNVAQVFTLPSILEPFGAVTNEALLGGCYALVSKLAGSACLVEENVNGNCIDPFDESAYAACLKAAFDKCEPIRLPLLLRENRMKENFRECFNRMLCNLKIT